MMTLFGRSLETASLTRLHWLAILLAIVTGAIHVYAGIIEGRLPVSLAGVGFLGAVLLFLFDVRRPLLYLVGILYTAVQLPLWYVVKAGEFSAIGYVDKTVQVALIVLLAFLYYSHRSAVRPGAESAAA